jgi:hypothetical protein
VVWQLVVKLLLWQVLNMLNIDAASSAWCFRFAGMLLLLPGPVLTGSSPAAVAAAAAVWLCWRLLLLGGSSKGTISGCCQQPVLCCCCEPCSRT